MPEAAPRADRSRWVALGVLLLATVLFRLPDLINAGAVDSDAAVVGLQARHILEGELSWFLWDAGYQASFEAILAAALFALFGATPLALMLTPLLGQLVLCGFGFGILRRRLGPWTALVCLLPLVLAPVTVVRVSLCPPRQWCITALFAAFWLLDTASQSRRPSWRYAGGLALAMVSLYLDLYALQFMVGVAAFALCCALDGGHDAPSLASLPRRLVACALGAGVGLALVLAIRQAPEAVGAAPLGLGSLEKNFRLLVDTCLPWLLGARVFIPGQELYPTPWRGPLVLEIVRWIGAISFLLAIAIGGLLLFLRRIPWRVRRLGVLGAVVAASSIGGFLVSPMPTDMWGARYLNAIIFVAPFALAPLASLLGGRRLGLFLAPYLIGVSMSGWLGYGNKVDGLLPVVTARGAAEDEAKLAAYLRERGIQHGAAQYWLAYRLSFLFEERPVIVPLNRGQDRYEPYRQGFESARTLALVFHPSEPRATPERYEIDLRRRKARYERAEVAGFTVLVVSR